MGRRSLVLDNRASAYLGRIFCLAPTTSSSSANPASNFCSLSTSFVSGSSIERGREGRPGRRVGEQQPSAMGGRRRPVSVAGIRYLSKESGNRLHKIDLQNAGHSYSVKSQFVHKAQIISV